MSDLLMMRRIPWQTGGWVRFMPQRALKGLILAISFAERRLASSMSKAFCSRRK